MIGEAAPDRTLWALTGADALTFLQGLVSNDVRPLAAGPGIVWAALLSPQGKYLADFFVVHRPGGGLLIDIATALAPATLRRLTMYRLRADVQLAPLGLHVHRGLDPTPKDALPDPRHPALGWRAWRAAPGAFERLHGVDFRKGCYVGQEVTARMKHKTDLRKGLVRLGIEGAAPIGTEITSEGKPAGVLFTQSAGRALAHLRLDRISDLRAGNARLWPETAAEGAPSAGVTNP